MVFAEKGHFDVSKDIFTQVSVSFPFLNGHVLTMVKIFILNFQICKNFLRFKKLQVEIFLSRRQMSG